MIFKVPLLWTFGASKSTINFANDYLTIYIIGTILVQISLGMNPFINTQGYAKTGMITVMVGAVINIILDPIFIFVLNMGGKGAAFASVLGQFISVIWILYFLFNKKVYLKLEKNM